MKIAKSIFIVVYLCLLLPVSLYCDDEDNVSVIVNLNEICTIELNNNFSVTLNVNTPAVGGGPVTGDTDSSKRLLYSSLVAGGTTRFITVNWGVADSAPAGTSLKVEVTSVPPNCGSQSGEVTVSDTAQNLITNIGGCNTGTGLNGAALKYTLSIDNISQLSVGDNQTVTLTFTLTDAM